MSPEAKSVHEVVMAPDTICPPATEPLEKKIPVTATPAKSKELAQKRSVDTIPVTPALVASTPNTSTTAVEATSSGATTSASIKVTATKPDLADKSARTAAQAMRRVSIDNVNPVATKSEAPDRTHSTPAATSGTPKESGGRKPAEKPEGTSEPPATDSQASWEARFQDLKAFRRYFGHANPKWHTRGKGVNQLACWLDHQRSFFREGIRLSPLQIEQLCEIGCTGFRRDESNQESVQQTNEPEERRLAWFSNFLGLRAFKAEVGHPNAVCKESKSETEKQLAVWLDGQRDTFRRGICQLPEQFQMLRDIGCTGFGGTTSLPNADETSPPRSVPVNSVTPGDGDRSANRDATSASIHEGADNEAITDHQHDGQKVRDDNTEDDGAQTQNGLQLAWKTKLRELDELMTDDQQREGIVRLNDNDVVCWEEGNSGGYDIIFGFLPGNVQFKDVVAEEQQKYNLKMKQNVVQAAGQVVSQIRRMIPPGRFLKKGEDGLWFDVGNVDAIKQALRTLREGSDEEDLEQDEGDNHNEAMEGDDIHMEAHGGEAVRSSRKESHVSMAGYGAGEENMENREDMEYGYEESYDDEEMEEEIEEDEDEEEERPTSVASAWDARFMELEDYEYQHGHPNPTKSKTSPYYKIGCWLSDQRRSYRNGRLPIEKARRLHNLGCTGFEDCYGPYGSATYEHHGGAVYPGDDEEEEQRLDDFGAGYSDDEEDRTKSAADKSSMLTWNERYEQLVDFKEIHGHCNPRESKKASSVAEKRLGRWLREQRLKLRNRKLPNDLVWKLCDLGCPGFEGKFSSQPVPKPRCSPWEKHIADLRGYKRRMGHCNPTQTRGAATAEYKLGRWLADQRKSFLNGNLSNAKAETLREMGCLGFEPPVAKESLKKNLRCVPWETRFLQMQEYKERYGHCNPRESKKDANGIENKLGRWSREQRKKYQDGNLSFERSQKLVRLGCMGFGVLDPNHSDPAEDEDDDDDDRFEEQGSVSVRSYDYDSDSIQAPHRRYSLTSAEGDAGDIQISLNANVVTWDSRFRDLMDYRNRVGHANPRRSRGASESDYKLGAWLSSQRVKYRGGKLEEDRIQKLIDLGCEGFDEETESELGYEGGTYSGDGGYEAEVIYHHSEYHAPRRASGTKQRKNWEAHFQELQAYRDEHGHAAPQQLRGSNPELVRWLTDQRFKFRRGSLATDKIGKLRDVGCKGFGDDDDEPVEIITEPNDNDVVCGRGGHTNTWPGNVQFRCIVQGLKKEYSTRKKHKKQDMAKGIINQIRSMNPPGRFLREDKNSGGWVDIGDELAIKKASQALRENRLDVAVNGKVKEEVNQSNDDGHEESVEGVMGYQSDSSEEVAPSPPEPPKRKRSTPPPKAKRSSGSSTKAKKRSSTSSTKAKKRSSTIVTWDSHFQDLHTYQEVNGHVDVGCSRGPDYRLGHWLADQRYKYRKGDLNHEKSEKLYKMGCKGFEDFGNEKSQDGPDSDPREVAQKEPQSSSQKGPASKKRKRFGVASNTPLCTTRAGRSSKKKRNDDYAFY